MDEHREYYAKWNKSDREDKYFMLSGIHAIQKIKQTSEYNKKETDSQI